MGRQICAAKGFLRHKQISYRAPNLDLHSHYWWLHSLRISCDSTARLWRNTIKTFHHTVVCVTTFTMPVHLHGTNFAPFLLLTRRCYDAETTPFCSFFPKLSSFFVVLLLLTGRCYEAEICTILLLLRCTFRWNHFLLKSKFSDFG